jgi:hypothetical protein
VSDKPHFSIVSTGRQWRVVDNYDERCSVLRTFDTREECVEWLRQLAL